MLKTDSKIFRNKVKEFILDSFNYEGAAIDYNYEPIERDFDAVKKVILEVFRSEKFYTDSYYVKHNIHESVAFHDWCLGLPTIFETFDSIACNPGDTLGGLLEQTPQERARYSSNDSEKMLCDLIYRELTR